MPSEPRVVPIACPFGRTGGVVYVYYIDAPEPALVDTGVAASPQSMIEPALNKAGISLSDVRWILATHGHWDHIGGAHAARAMAADGVKLALHADDAELLRSRRVHMQPSGYQALRFRYLDDMAGLASQEALVFENISGELGADRELHGGERISLGGDVTIEVVHTPGHSPGSASFVLDGLDWAFTGDGVQVAGSESGSFPLYVDPIAYGATQKRLLEDIRPKRLHMGHRFRGLDGSVLEPVLDGLHVERALRDSLIMHERVVAAARSVTAPAAAQPKAESLKPAAEALGLQTLDPSTWPSAFITTLHGHVSRASSQS